MIYPPPINSAAVAEHFKTALSGAKRDDWPYRHWNLKEVFPEALCTGILALPIEPPQLGKTDGTRGTYNDKRCFFTPQMRADYAACAALCDALQRPDVAKLVAKTCEVDVEGPICAWSTSRTSTAPGSSRTTTSRKSCSRW